MSDKKEIKKLRLILGDQLNIHHSWFNTTDDSICYVLMEIKQETDYAPHHIQKVASFFAAMRHFANTLKQKKHRVIYFKLDDKNNLQTFEKNINQLFIQYKFAEFEYQLPDEYRLDKALQSISQKLKILSKAVDSEHFLSTRDELGLFFENKKMYLMESFYRYMRKKHNLLMENNEPLTGKWNYDKENRKKLPNNHIPTPPLLFKNDVNEITATLKTLSIKTIGEINPDELIWPISREQSLTLLDFFVNECLPLFGTYEDAMTTNSWAIYHSRLSFALNTKLISPKEVINKAIEAWSNNSDKIEFNQLEGFVRQIVGWREYMRGIYWLKMPQFASMNYFNNQAQLPNWFWTGKTKMNCLKHTINQSLTYGYAHHIQRLMITGNFALLAEVHPDEVDKWYLGIYIDAIEWVEITNTRGMSQFADGGIIGTKPYVSSAAYIDKMSNYCQSCFYNKSKKTGDKACPFNSLYWNFYDRNTKLLSKNPRIGMMYNVWNKMKQEDKIALLEQANYYLEHINEL